MKRHIIAWDGEGANVDGVHIFNLLSNSLGQYIHDDSGLSTNHCFEFFIQNNPADAIHVIFGGGYDVNMILRDLPRNKVEELWKKGRCKWKQWKIN